MSSNAAECVKAAGVNPFNRKMKKVYDLIDDGYELLISNWNGMFILEKHCNGHQNRVEISGSTLLPKVFVTTV